MIRFAKLFALALTLCALPTLALAQPTDIPHEQPAQPAPPPDMQPTQPPPDMQPPPAAQPQPAPHPRYQPVRPGYQPNTTYSRYRSSWYIGFGIGGGSGWVSLGDDHSDSQGGVAINFKVGAVVTPQLLIGFEGSAWRYQDSEDVAIQFNHYDAVATFFPFHDGGFFVKGGAGLGVILLDYGAWGSDTSEAGFDLKLGLGYEFQLGRTFNLGADLSYAFTKYDGIDTHDVGLHLSLMWY